MLEPHWLKVLDHFVKRRFVFNGLTIPFLIGSELLLGSSKDFITVAGIISQMQDEKLKSRICLMRCNSIGEYVFGILDRESIKFDLEHSIYRSYNNLTITDDSLDTFDDLEGIVAEFESRYSGCLSASEFSKLNGRWIPFSHQDRDRILEVMA